jgi:hypothetical protein
MSALGQKRTCAVHTPMSALPPKATLIATRDDHVPHCPTAPPARGPGVGHGAFSVPITAQAALLGPSATEGAPSSECTIKGNISRNGERIYHMENQRFYARIKMNKGDGRRWFCTPEEAEAAGWRRAFR